MKQYYACYIRHALDVSDVWSEVLISLQYFPETHRQRLYFFKKIIEDMASRGEVDPLSRYGSLRANEIQGDTRFVVLHKELSFESDLPWLDKMLMEGYFVLKKVSLSEERSFGLDTSSVTKELVPLVLSPARNFELRRIEDDTQHLSLQLHRHPEV